MSASNLKELEELNHNLDRSEKDVYLLKNQMKQAQGKYRKLKYLKTILKLMM